MTGTFIDTIIICSLTGLTLVVTGVYTGDLNGAAMTATAFGMAFPTAAKYLLFVGLGLFAFSTVLGWNYYGERCVEYLAGVKGILPYRLFFVAMVGLAGFIKLEMIWTIADIVNGLMAFPNLIALVLLTPVVVQESKAYFAHVERVYERKEKLDLAKTNAEESVSGI